jgi:hypothetical protein
VKSIKSILNPTDPLALRVSGHLMLGVIRIYSRKVQYLMTDCTEALWRIKLVYKPTTVDAVTNAPGASVNLDDVRHFGNIAHDADFPELEGAAFSQAYRLPTFKNRTIATERETTEAPYDAETLDWFGMQVSILYASHLAAVFHEDSL